MGSSKSKTGSQKTLKSRILLPTGVPVLDELYKRCDSVLKELKEYEKELNICTTNLIKALGVGDFWKKGGNLSEIVIMILVVLSAECNANFESIGLILNFSTPYISVKKTKLILNTRQIIKNFEDLVSIVDKISQKIPLLLEILHESASKSYQLSKKVLKNTNNSSYSVEDMLKAIKNNDYNRKKILKAPGGLFKLNQIAENAKDRILEAIEKAQTPSNSIVIKKHGLYAHSKGLRNPSTIINKFWPQINNN